MTTAPFSILERLADSDRPYFATPKELRILANELEMHGGYQIQMWERKADRGGCIEFIVTYEEKKK
jgi:hypothetical protein